MTIGLILYDCFIETPSDCDAGTYRRRAFCLYRWFDMEECELCPENTYSFSGSAGCTNCSEGMFANDERVNCSGQSAIIEMSSKTVKRSF